MATEFAKAREAARRAGKSSFSWEGKKYRTTPVGTDVNDASKLRGSMIDPMEKPKAAPAAAPAPSASSTSKPSTSSTPMREPANPPRGSATTAPANPASDRAAGIAASRTVTRRIEEDRETRASRSDDAKAEAKDKGDERGFFRRAADFVTTGRPMTTPDEIGEAVSRKAASVKERAEGKDTQEPYSAKLDRENAKTEQMKSDKALKALDDAIASARRNKNDVLLEDLTEKRKAYIAKRYGREG